MKRSPPAASPDAYVAALSGWRRACVEQLRDAVRGTARGTARGPASLTETIKWGNVVYIARGPVLMVRAEESRVLLGFWRGRRLREIEPRLRPGGKYEMATLELREGDSVSTGTVRRLTREALRLDATLGDPTDAARG